MFVLHVFVNLRNLQNAQCNFEVVHSQFANFWPKPDINFNPNHNPNLELNSEPYPKANPRQIAQYILQIA